MVEWDKVLSWQAEMTDTIDREEIELRAYQSMKQVLQSQRKKAFEADRLKEMAAIDSYLIQLNLILNFKTMMIQHLRLQFSKTIEQLS